MAVVSTPVGKVSITPKGTWSSSATYERLDVVTKDGSSYIALQSNTNKAVTNTAYWMCLAEKGEAGASFDEGGITGVIGIANGGTGASTKAGALTSLGAASVSHTHSASDIDSGTLPIARGGTNATTAAAARTNLNVVNKSGDTMTGALELSGASLKLTPSDTTNYSYALATPNNTALRFSQYNGSIYEAYVFPQHSSDSSKVFSILTSKNPVTIAQGGTGNTTGNAATATKLETARTIRTNLASTSTASFDGSGNITPGVTGTLPIANGGTGATTAANARTALGAVAKTGDVMTGRLVIRGSSNYLSLENDDSATNAAWLQNSSNRTYFRSYNRTTTYRIDAYLPIPDASETAHSTKYIPFMTAGTSDLTAGTSALTTNCIRLVYE